MSENCFIAACVQSCAGQNVDANIAEITALVQEAAAHGAVYIQTPENSSFMEGPQDTFLEYIFAQKDDPALAHFRTLADKLKIWLHIGSLAIKIDKNTAVNRSFIITPNGTIAATYDKIHMFDVNLCNGEQYQESKKFRPGNTAVIVDLPWCKLGLSICYDVRFAYLYRAMAQSGASVLSAPAAFTLQTGKKHWHILQRARAIETGSFVISAAQCGLHENGRQTYGHSIIISPWGEILAEALNDQCIIIASINPSESRRVRQQIPSLQHDRSIDICTKDASEIKS